MNKRTFLKRTMLLSLGSIASYSALCKMVDAVAHRSAEEVAAYEDFWAGIRNGIS